MNHKDAKIQQSILRRVIEVIIDIFRGIGLALVLSPLVLYQFIHSDHERYAWLISGPYPFSNFGSGPFQLFMFIGLVLTGVILLILSITLKKASIKRWSYDELK